MWKIYLSALLSVFATVWICAVWKQIKKRFDDDDNWPGGNTVTP